MLPLPDFTKPPPGFPAIPPGPPPPMRPPPPAAPINDKDLMPTVPYFDLPAGLMAPLVKVKECEYLAARSHLDIVFAIVSAPMPSRMQKWVLCS